MNNARRPNRRDNKQLKREEAEIKQAEYDKLTTMQKIEKLDYMLGANVGAVKQRARLKSQLEKEFEEKDLAEKIKVVEKEKKDAKKAKKDSK